MQHRSQAYLGSTPRMTKDGPPQKNFGKSVPPQFGPCPPHEFPKFSKFSVLVSSPPHIPPRKISQSVPVQNFSTCRGMSLTNRILNPSHDYLDNTKTKGQAQINPKICKPQCGNFMIFLSLRFYVKSNLGILEVQNLPI